jgi:hypothetical protein
MVVQGTFTDRDLVGGSDGKHMSCVLRASVLLINKMQETQQSDLAAMMRLESTPCCKALMQYMGISPLGSRARPYSMHSLNRR